MHAPDNSNSLRIKLDTASQGVNRLYILAFNNVADNNNQVSRNGYRKYFLPIVEIKDYNVIIDDINFYDQPINGAIKQYHEIRKIAAIQRYD